MASDGLIEDSPANSTDFTGKDVLEVGCGTGSFTLDYLASARYVLCVEPDETALADLEAVWAEETVNAVLDTCHGSIVDVPLPPCSFDIAVFSHSF